MSLIKEIREKEVEVAKISIHLYLLLRRLIEQESKLIEKYKKGRSIRRR